MDPTSLPLFPLGLVLYPEEELAIHIFEPKYRDLVRDCQNRDIPFGVVLFQDGKMSEVGCTARIGAVMTSNDDETRDIVVAGVSRFRILDVRHERAYLTADIESLVDEDHPVSKEVREHLIVQHIKLLELAGRGPTPSTYQEKESLSFFIAHNAGLSIDQKQRVLELAGEADRLAFLVDHLERFIPVVEEAESLREKVRSNGHFKDFPPPDEDDVSN